LAQAILAQASARSPAVPGPQGPLLAWWRVAKVATHARVVLRLYCLVILAALCVAPMPHCRSVVARAARRERALLRGYVLPVHRGSRLLEVPAPLRGHVRTMAKSLEAHAVNDSLAGTRHHSARLSALAAHRCGALSDSGLRHAVALHRAADRAKHAPPPAPPCGPALSPRAPATPRRVAWADLRDSIGDVHLPEASLLACSVGVQTDSLPWGGDAFSFLDASTQTLDEEPPLLDLLRESSDACSPTADLVTELQTQLDELRADAARLSQALAELEASLLQCPTKDELQRVLRQVASDLGPSVAQASTTAALSAVEGAAGKLSDSFVAQFETLNARLEHSEARLLVLEACPPPAQGSPERPGPPEPFTEDSEVAVGLAVRIFGLSKAQHLNDRLGIVEGRDDSSGRLIVRLDPMSNPVKILPNNCQFPARCPRCCRVCSCSPACFACGYGTACDDGGDEPSCAASAAAPPAAPSTATCSTTSATFTSSAVSPAPSADPVARRPRG